jgi:hypothetical protein
MHNDGISFNATLVAMCQIYCPDEIPVIYISQANQSSSIVAWAQKMRFRFIVGVHNHAVLDVPFEGQGWGAVELIRDTSTLAGTMRIAYCSTLPSLLEKLGCGYGNRFEICLLTGKWRQRSDGDSKQHLSPSSKRRYQIIENDMTVCSL